MLNKKKAQQALEFMLVLVFVMVIISGVMFLSGKLLVDFKDKENNIQVLNFIESIEQEIEILNKAQKGYYRELELSTRDYHVNVSSGTLIVKDLRNNNKTYYYEITGNFNVFVKEVIRDGNKITIIVFEKVPVFSSNGLILNKIDISTLPAGGSSVVGTTEVIFNIGTICPAGYIKLYALYWLSSSHAEIASENSYPYSVCIKNSVHSLSAPLSCANTNRLFYLGDVTLSHLWLDNTTAYVPYPGYYNWQEVCLTSPSATIDIIYDINDKTGDGYSCVGSFYSENIDYGATFANCADYSPAYIKIWVKID